MVHIYAWQEKYRKKLFVSLIFMWIIELKSRRFVHDSTVHSRFIWVASSMQVASSI